MFEYAISDGEGTLVDYGVLECYWINLYAIEVRKAKQSMIFAPCENGCETGK